MILRNVVVLLGLAVGVMGCQSRDQAPLSATDDAAIREALAAEMEAANAGDEVAWASLYADDAVVLRPHATSLRGRQSIQEWLATLPAISNARGEVEEVVGVSDLAYSMGRYEMTFSIPGATMPIEERGKFVQVFRRQGDGTWKMVREIYNSDLPMPAPPAQPGI